MVKKNEQQLRFLYGEEFVDIMRSAMLDAIHQGKCKTISLDSIDKELNKIAKKNRRKSQ